MRKLLNKILVLLKIKEPTIDWEEGDIMDYWTDEPMYWAEMDGVDELGRKYVATGEYCGNWSTHSDLIEITDIERV